MSYHRRAGTTARNRASPRTRRKSVVSAATASRTRCGMTIGYDYPVAAQLVLNRRIACALSWLVGHGARGAPADITAALARSPPVPRRAGHPIRSAAATERPASSGTAAGSRPYPVTRHKAALPRRSMRLRESPRASGTSATTVPEASLVFETRATHRQARNRREQRRAAGASPRDQLTITPTDCPRDHGIRRSRTDDVTSIEPLEEPRPAVEAHRRNLSRWRHDR